MSLDLPGFADPVGEAQQAFRAVLDAFARPGSLHPAGARLTPPAPLDPATAAVILTLVDADAPLFVTEQFAAARDWLVFHAGARLADTPGSARFVLATALPDLGGLDSGTDEAPEEGATLILQLPALEGGPTLRLDGPGLRVPATFAPVGLGDGFAAQWADNRALSPRGIDLILCAGDRLAALPRSTVVISATIGER